MRTVEATARRRHEHYKQKAIAEAQPLIEQAIAGARAEARAEDNKRADRAGGVVDGFKSKWHKPSKQAKADAEAIKQQAQAYADRTNQQAERLVQDARNSRRPIQRALEKQTNIASNLEIENKRLQRELEGLRGTASNRQGHKFKR